MSKDYVADNAGTGFASFDDDGPSDLDSLLAGAALGEEEDDQETASYFTDADPSVFTSKSDGFDQASSTYQSSAPREEPKPAAPAPALTIEDEEDYDDLPVQEPAYVAPVSVEAVYVEPVYTTPVETQPTYTAPVEPQPTRSESLGKRSWERDPNPLVIPSTSVQQPFAEPKPADARSSRRINIPTEADEISLAGKVIRIIDAYRKLNQEVRSVASQFITGGSEIINDEATLAIKVINADPMLSVTMKALREAKDLDPVERVFFVIDLEEDVLHSLGGLVGVFVGKTFDDTLDKIKYSRVVVSEIGELDERAINYVESTESILAAADEESN